MGSFRNELKHVFRRLSRSPVFTALTLITLALGIGANTAIFSVVNGILLKPLPYSDPERLVGVWESAPGVNIKDLNASPATYFTFREEGRVFEESGIYRTDKFTVTGLAEPEQVVGLEVTEGVLPLLGVQPIRGRFFTHQEDSREGPETAILSHAYWQRRFGGDSSAIGRRILLDGRPREIIGVMPQGFRFMDRDAALIVPLRLRRSEVFVGNFSYRGLARLKPGVTLAQANADVARMLPMMLGKFPPPPGMSMKIMEEIRIVPNLRPLKQDVVGDVGKVLWILMATVGIVLLIACANVANLLLVRADGRQQELAIRAALGAGWGRIARELLVESITLGVIGGALGLGVAHGALRLLVYLAPAGLPRLSEISIDPQVVLFTFAISLIAGILFGLLPVVRYARPGIANALHEGGRTASEGRQRHRTRSALVVVQVALALVLLISSGLMIRSLRALKQVDPGYRSPEEILTLRVNIPDALVKEAEQVVRMEQDIAQKIAAIPGVKSVGLTSSVTMDGYDSNDPIYAEDRVYSEGQLPALRRYKFISPGHFHTMGAALLAGRDLTWTDIYDGRPVLLIAENLARELWGTPGAAIGKRVRENPKGQWREIIGVVGNERDNGVDQKAPTVVYWPLMISKFWGFSSRVERTPAFAIRSSRAGSASLLNDVRQAIWSVNSNLPVADVRTVEEIARRSMARTSFTLVMLGIAAGVALLLGVVGIYGVISYSVSQRTREIGIRMALGAQQGAIRRMFVEHGLRLVGIGVVCGIAAAVALTRLMASLLFEVSPVDPVTYVAVSVVLAGAAWLATYVPARRATGIEPVEALRVE